MSTNAVESRDDADPILAAIGRAPVGEALSADEQDAVDEGVRSIAAGRTVAHGVSGCERGQAAPS